MKLTKEFNKLTRIIGKNSPILLTVGGALGLGVTAFLSYKAAKKVEVIVDQIEADRDDELEVNRFEVAKNITGAIALPVVTGIASVACIILSYQIQNNRITSLAAALATVTAEHRYYKEKFKKEFGEEAYDKFTTPVTSEKRKIAGADGKEKLQVVDIKESVSSLHGAWYDKSTEYLSDDHEYNMAYIRSVDSNLQLKLFRKGFLLLNEVLETLGLPRTRAGALIGWSTEHNFYLTPEVTNCLDNASQQILPQIYVKWTEPSYIYDSVEFNTRD